MAATTAEALTREQERSRRKRTVRKRTEDLRRAGKRARRAELIELAPVVRLADMIRPKTRGECVDGPRPCPWVSCRHHLYLETNLVKQNGSVTLNFPDLEPDGLEGPLESCSLDVADEGGHGYERVADLMNCTREWVRQLEERALKKIRLPMARITDEEER